jgi:hypothetical protein
MLAPLRRTLMLLRLPQAFQRLLDEGHARIWLCEVRDDSAEREVG